MVPYAVHAREGALDRENAPLEKLTLLHISISILNSEWTLSSLGVCASAGEKEIRSRSSRARTENLTWLIWRSW